MVKFRTTACKWDTIIPFEEMWLRLNKLIKPNGAIVLFGSEPFSSLLRVSNLKMYKYDWIYKKQQGTGHLNAKKQPLRISETISLFYKKPLLFVLVLSLVFIFSQIMQLKQKLRTNINV